MSRKFLATAAPPSPIDLNPRRDPPLDFPYREWGELTPADYGTLGFMCGLEIHQQILTERKLFCRCPAGGRMRRVDGEVLRHMRPTLSELGLYDGCALMEFKTRKEIVYLLDRRCVCTYELDDTPPFPMDEQAIQIAIEIAHLHDMSLVSELQVMRKQYLDGSIPTGFQRTAVVAVGGAIPFPQSELGRDQVIRLRQLTLEEDSCREVSDIGHRIRFKTDRLGMPLTETVTDPDLLTPYDVAAGGRLLASISRASGKVRRGVGAARQDVNVSIAGGRRVELKGVAHHRGLPRLVHVEALRQLELLKIKHELERRGVTREMLAIPGHEEPWHSPLVVDAQRMLRRTRFDPVRDAVERGDFIAAVRLPAFGELLARPTQPGITFAREFEDRVRVIACLTGQPFIVASHVLSYGLTPADWRRLRAALHADDEDAIVVVWGPRQDVDTAVREVLIRAQEALDGVPSETRQTFRDGTTGLERILPGPERMYPDTDTPPIPILDEWVDRITTDLAERPWERAGRYLDLGLTREAAARLATAPYAALFDAVAPATPDAARRLATALECRLVHHWRATRTRTLPDVERIAPLVRALEQGHMRAEVFARLFDRLLRDGAADAESLIAEASPAEGDESALAEAAAQTATLVRGGRLTDPEAQLRHALGLVMPRFLGKLDPAVVRTALAQELGVAEGPAGRRPT